MVDPRIKAQAEEVFKQNGLNHDEALSLFYKQVAETKTLPFKTGNVSAAIPRPKLDKSWQAWVDENLERRCDPEEILGILLKNEFPLMAIADAMGSQFPANSELVTGHKPQQKLVDHEALSKIRITDEAVSGAKAVPNDKVQIYTLEGFMTPEECDKLVELTSISLRPSTITIPSSDKYFRTSTSSDLCFMNDDFIDMIDARLAEVIGIAPEYGEGIQAQRYEVGQQFKHHTDYFEPNTAEYEKHASKRGNRTWTFMVYLNDTKKGGGTNFPNIDKTFYPKKGNAVIWNNLYRDGSVNRDTLHSGMPVEEGEKIIITKWFREKPV